MVEGMVNILQGKEPTVSRSPRKLKNAIDCSLDSRISVFGEVFVVGYGSLYQSERMRAQRMSLMRVLLSARAQSLISLSMAPHSRIYSSRVLTNSFSV
jgi:hypothetical protein